MKKIFLLLVISLFIFININNSFSSWLSVEDKIEKQISEYIEELDYEQRRAFWKMRSDYRNYSSMYEIEVYKEKYKIGISNKENKIKYLKKKENILKKMEILSEDIAKVFKNYKWNNEYKITNELLKELKINQYIEINIQNSKDSFYKQILRIWIDNPFMLLEDFDNNESNFILPKGFNNTIYIVKTKGQKDKYNNIWNDIIWNDLELISSIEFWNKRLYDKKEFKKLDFKKVNFEEFKKNWLKIDYTKEFKKLQNQNMISISMFVEYNGLYIWLDWNTFSFLNNTEKGKENYLKGLYYKKLWINNDYEFRKNRSNCDNKLLNEKIKKIINNIETKLNNKEKFNKFLKNIKWKLEIINSQYKENWLEIAWKINKDSNISVIFKEYEKHMYKWEILEVLWKYLWFKSKENYYDSTIDEIFEIN